jgi:branched-chain amino acid transport system ATP-binding protein
MALLEVKEASVRFGGICAVDNASFEVEAGSITGLIGPNGAGKTTTFNVITGLQPPTSGEVWYKGRNVTHAGVDRRAKMGMARTFQRLEAFGSLSVRENITVARDILAGPRAWFRNSRDPVVDDLIEQVGLRRYVDVRADLLPTGVARLLELARALAIEPDLLLLDEPSSGLDESETESFGELLTDLAARGKAVLMVEHDMDLVFAVCHWIHVLEFGRIIASGTPDDIRNNPIVQAAYLGNADEADIPDDVDAEARAAVAGRHAAGPEDTRVLTRETA